LRWAIEHLKRYLNNVKKGANSGRENVTGGVDTVIAKPGPKKELTSPYSEEGRPLPDHW